MWNCSCTLPACPPVPCVLCVSPSAGVAVLLPVLCLSISVPSSPRVPLSLQCALYASVSPGHPLRLQVHPLCQPTLHAPCMLLQFDEPSMPLYPQCAPVFKCAPMLPSTPCVPPCLQCALYAIVSPVHTLCLQVLPMSLNTLLCL